MNAHVLNLLFQSAVSITKPITFSYFLFLISFTLFQKELTLIFDARYVISLSIFHTLSLLFLFSDLLLSLSLSLVCRFQ
jgi:hypothetical protein